VKTLHNTIQLISFGTTQNAQEFCPSEVLTPLWSELPAL